MRRVYIGYDPRDEMAMRACVSSLIKHATIPLDIILLRENELRKRGVYWRGYRVAGSGQMIDDRDGRPFSTQFSFTRFAIPLIDKESGWVLFCDADMLFRRDVAELFALVESSKAVMCVQHDHTPPETTKMDGMIQTQYKRKNWSSLMLMQPEMCDITKYWLNNETGAFLHALCWQREETIGALPHEWNWLEGWSSPDIDPAVVHFTRGTPDMIGDDLPFASDWWDAVAEWRPDMCRTLDWGKNGRRQTD
jgi:hypothetical protein